MSHQSTTTINPAPSKGYKHTDCFFSVYLQVNPLHRVHCVHYEQYGHPTGIPAIFLHGVPGGRTRPTDTTFFNPEIYRVLLFDQRGAGKSLPAAELRENTSRHLVSDIEALHEHLQISVWHVVFGGSWGSTPALLYAQAHPERESAP